MKIRTKEIALISTLLILFAGAVTTSCTDELLITPEVDVPDTVSFETDIIPIFEASCNSVGCHNTGGIPPDLTAPNAYINLTLFGYLDTVDPASSELYTKIDGGSMDIYATDQERALILAWIEQGALDN